MTWTSVASREAPAYSSSAWAATVNDVALGIADVGLSLFWMTADRLEMTSFTSKQILMQAGVSMLAQANQMPQNLLKLLS